MKLAIYGYGNLGRGVEAAIRQNPDATLVGVFTRRDPKTVCTKTGAPVFAADERDRSAGAHADACKGFQRDRQFRHAREYPEAL